MKVCFVFPGQGSHYVGMFSPFLEKSEYRYYFQVIERILGKEFIDKIQNGPEEVLKDTRISQPAIFSVSAMLSDFLKKEGILAEYAVGHSLGEYSAFYYAEVYNFEDGLNLIKKRSEVMSEVAEKVKGGMWAILSGDLGEIENSVKESQKEGLNIFIANYNSPGQIVLSGENEAYDFWYQKMKDKIKRVVPLPVSGPFHSPLMKEAEEIFKEYLINFNFNKPKYKVFSSTTCDFVENNIKDILIKQFTGSVRWIETINSIYNLGIDYFIEVGPGKVLQGLIKKIIPEVKVLGIEKPEDLETLKGELGC